MGLLRRWRKLDPHQKERIYSLLGLIGALFGKGGRALMIIQILDSIPGRVDAFKAAREKIDRYAAMIENRREAASEIAATVGGTPAVAEALQLNDDEILALDDALDLSVKSSRALKRILKGKKDEDDDD